MYLVLLPIPISKARIANAIFVPGSNPQKSGYIFIFANLANFYVAAILAISTKT